MGAAFILDISLNSMIIDFKPLFDLSIIDAQAPTKEKKEGDKDRFYQ